MSQPDSVTVREIDPDSQAEVELVATRMRETLVEVLGRERGEAMYTLDWLVQRVRFHLDPAQCTGAVFVAETSGGDLAGHTIVRLDADHRGLSCGLFSTTYVAPDHRRQAIASRLLERGERWLREHGAHEAVTYTDENNAKLIELYTAHGYALTPAPDEFVRLGRVLD